MAAQPNEVMFRAAAGGTADFAVGAVIDGYLLPSQATAPALVDNKEYDCRAESDDKTQHESGLYTWRAGIDTFERTTIRQNNLGNTSKVPFSAAPKVMVSASMLSLVGTIQQSGSDVVERANTINFTGAGVAVTDSGSGVADVAITGGAGGWELISSGTIVDDTAISLSGSYSVYEMHLIGLSVDADGIYSTRVSADGGSTWFDDSADYNSNNVSGADDIQFDQGLVIRDPSVIGGRKIQVKLTIDPGASDVYGSIVINGVIPQNAGTPPQPSLNSVYFTQGNRVGPARMNAIKFKPLWGDSRVTVSGEYRLLGLA